MHLPLVVEERFVADKPGPLPINGAGDVQIRIPDAGLVIRIQAPNRARGIPVGVVEVCHAD